MELQNITFNVPKIAPLKTNNSTAFKHVTNPIDKFEKKIPNVEDSLKELENIKTDGKNRFSKSDIKSFSYLSPEKLNNVKYFAQTNLSSFNIKWIVEKNDTDFKKLSQMICDEEKDDKFVSISFTNDSAQNSNYILSSSGKDYEKVKLLDKDLNILSTEKSVSKGDFKYIETEDLKNNTFIKAKTDKKGILLKEIKVYKDKDGNTLKTRYTEPSEIEGIYNVKVKNSDGTTEVIISEGKIDKTAGTSEITKNMTSFDGTKTEYNYKFDNNGIRISNYKIIDKNGKILLNNKENFTVLSDKKAVSQKNGKTYEIFYDDDKISVKNDGFTTEINLNSFAIGDISPMKKLSGNELIQMKNNVTKFGGSKGNFAAYDVFTKAVNTSDNKISTLLHELGHAKDYRNSDMEISNDKDFLSVFEIEKKAFTENSSNYERNLIQYFIRPKCHHAGKDGGKVETVAEVNSILNSPGDDMETAIRKQLLQQYFPKTIAVLSEKLEKLSDKPLKVTSNTAFGH